MIANKEKKKYPKRSKAGIAGLKKTDKGIDAGLLELYALYSVSKALNLSFALEEIFSNTVDIISKTLRMDEFCVMLANESSGELEMKACYPYREELPPVCIKAGEGVLGSVAKTGKPVCIQDAKQESGFLFCSGAKTDIGAFLNVPLIGRQKNILGVLCVHKTLPNSLTNKDKEFFLEVAHQIAIAVEKATLYERTREASMRDELTGLHNRRYFFDCIERELHRAMRYNTRFSVLMMDIDHFKDFNDRNGHLKGDNVLRDMARLLRGRLRSSDIVARYGGEEFICLLPETDKDAASLAAEKIRRVVEGHAFEGGDGQPGGKLTTTIGVASWPGDGGSSLELINCADKALYSGKRSGRNRVCRMIEGA